MSDPSPLEPNEGNGGPPPTWDPGKVTQRGEHIFGIEEEDGQVRWACACGKHGRWVKTGATLYGGWTEHTVE